MIWCDSPFMEKWEWALIISDGMAHFKSPGMWESAKIIELCKWCDLHCLTENQRLVIRLMLSFSCSQRFWSSVGFNCFPEEAKQRAARKVTLIRSYTAKTCWKVYEQFSFYVVVCLVYLMFAHLTARCTCWSCLATEWCSTWLVNFALSRIHSLLLAVYVHAIHN